MQQFIEKYADQTLGVLNGFDRLVFRGSLRRLNPDFSQRRPWLSGAPVHVKFSAAGPKKDVHFCNVYYAEVRTGRPRADQRTANTMSALR